MTMDYDQRETELFCLAREMLLSAARGTGSDSSVQYDALALWSVRASRRFFEEIERTRPAECTKAPWEIVMPPKKPKRPLDRAALDAAIEEAKMMERVNDGEDEVR